MAENTAGKSETEKRINFSVLQKHDNEIERIIDTASSVAHYKFNSSSGVWVSLIYIVDDINQGLLESRLSLLAFLSRYI